MKIRSYVSPDTLCLEVFGEMDWPSSVRALKDALTDAKNYSEIYLDLSNAAFAGSAFINLLAEFHRDYPDIAAKTRIQNPPSCTRQLLEIFGMEKIFEIENEDIEWRNAVAA